MSRVVMLLHAAIRLRIAHWQLTRRRYRDDIPGAACYAEGSGICDDGGPTADLSTSAASPAATSPPAPAAASRAAAFFGDGT